jgi:hypothetical protein
MTAARGPSRTLFGPDGRERGNVFHRGRVVARTIIPGSPHLVRARGGLPRPTNAETISLFSRADLLGSFRLGV